MREGLCTTVMSSMHESFRLLCCLLKKCMTTDRGNSQAQPQALTSADIEAWSLAEAQGAKEGCQPLDIRRNDTESVSLEHFPAHLVAIPICRGGKATSWGIADLVHRPRLQVCV